MALAETTVPQGKADRWDRDRIALLALLLLSDADEAALLWDSLAPRNYRGILGAVPFDSVGDSGTFTSDATDNTKSWKINQWRDEFSVKVGRKVSRITGNTETRLSFADSDGTADEKYKITRTGVLPLWWFDKHSQRYGTRDRFVQTAGILAAIESFREGAIGRAQGDVTVLYTGGTDIGLWQEETAAFLKTVSLASVALGVGGTGNLSGKDLNEASGSLNFHLERLRGFAVDIQNGNLNEEAAQHRAGLYPQSIITGGFDDARRRSAMSVGMLEEINVLSDSEHCQTTAATPGCADLTELGWVPIGTLPPPGERTCSFQCRCHLEFRRSEAESN